MSSRRLIEMVHEGRASFKTYATGGGAVWRIPVPKDQYIILTKIVYHPFVDADRSDAAYNAHTHHSLILVTSQKQHYFNFRDNFMVTDNSLDPGNLIFNPGTAEQRSVYIPFEETVKICLKNMLLGDPSGWLSTFAALPAGVDEPNIPIGYGTTLQTITEFLSEGVNVAPLTNNILPTSIIGAPGTDQWFGNNTPLQNPVGLVNFNGMSFPLIDFEYFQVYEPMPDCMKGK